MQLAIRLISLCGSNDRMRNENLRFTAFQTKFPADTVINNSQPSEVASYEDLRFCRRFTQLWSLRNFCTLPPSSGRLAAKKLDKRTAAMS